MLACALAVAGLSVTGAAAAHATTRPVTYNVLRFGANGGGTVDNTAAFAAAITAVEAAGGGTVYVPAGTYAFTSADTHDLPTSIRLWGTAPVRLMGEGRKETSLVEHVRSQTLISMEADGSAIEKLTLDSKTDGGGDVLTVRANHTLLAHDRVYGATKTVKIGSGLGSPFALFYQGPYTAKVRAPTYNVGNTIDDIILEDGVNNDGFSFSFQKDATITNVTHFGSRLALYIDSHVRVSNYAYTPNPACIGATDGFYITSPSDHITINGFVTSGEGGIIGGHTALASTAITITGERFLAASGEVLQVGNVNGLTMSGSNFNAGNELLVYAPNLVEGMVVSGSRLPSVDLSAYEGHTYTSAHMTFDNDTFPAFTSAGGYRDTFRELAAVGPGTVWVTGGRWSNATGGFYKGTTTTFHVNSLNGYP